MDGHPLLGCPFDFLVLDNHSENEGVHYQNRNNNSHNVRPRNLKIYLDSTENGLSDSCKDSDMPKYFHSGNTGIVFRLVGLVLKHPDEIEDDVTDGDCDSDAVQ